MQAVAEGRLAISDDFIEHMNCCLACRACETACPSDVQYGKLIEAAREQIRLETGTIAAKEGDHSHGTGEYTSLLSPTTRPSRASLTAELLRHFFFDVMLPSRLVTSLVFAGLKFYQRSGLQTVVRRTGLLDAINALPTPFQGKLKIPEALMDSATGDLLPALLPEITPALGQRRYRVGFLSGCIMDQVFRNINEATIRVLAANGCEVITPPQQVCCGALHVHEGETKRGLELARHNIDVFEQYDCDAIIINSAGCGSNLKEYGHLLRDDPAYASRAQVFSKKVKDVSEFLTSIELNFQMGEVARVVTYHDACHLAHGQKIRQQPRQLLKAIPGLTLVDLHEADWCCGSAGIYNITKQEMGSQLLDRKMNNIVATGASTIATGNPGCFMQIALGVRERGLPMDVVHPVQLLDEAYRAGGLYSTPIRDGVAVQRQQRALFIGIGMSLLIGAFLLGRRRQK
jgi:glycolate oxidase iron-sulfur subunit